MGANSGAGSKAEPKAAQEPPAATSTAGLAAALKAEAQGPTAELVEKRRRALRRMAPVMPQRP
ncbi:MAG TPA: hypothetical protein DDY43_10760 [Synechococcales bacterium UBA10510]|nr:hypothetical protein [Synechococcales bacterium UBA10510]